MKNGTTISRAFSLPSTVDPAMMDAAQPHRGTRRGTLRHLSRPCHHGLRRQLHPVFNQWKGLKVPAVERRPLREFPAAYQKDLGSFPKATRTADLWRVQTDYHGASGRKALYPNLAGCTFQLPGLCLLHQHHPVPAGERRLDRALYLRQLLARLSDYEISPQRSQRPSRHP